jgi:metallo-beta-lactamase family protein
MPKITFLGAAGTVTGSKYLVEAEGKKRLVDCGLLEGSKALKQMKSLGLDFRVAGHEPGILAELLAD